MSSIKKHAHPQIASQFPIRSRHSRTADLDLRKHIAPMCRHPLSHSFVARNARRENKRPMSGLRYRQPADPLQKHFRWKMLHLKLSPRLATNNARPSRDDFSIFKRRLTLAVATRITIPIKTCIPSIGRFRCPRRQLILQ